MLLNVSLRQPKGNHDGAHFQTKFKIYFVTQNKSLLGQRKGGRIRLVIMTEVKGKIVIKDNTTLKDIIIRKIKRVKL